MGGKVWSDKEERVFWETVIPQSPIAPDPEEQKLSWDACSKAMQQAMGDEARREYTGSMLYEHYYQNLKPGPRPKAKKYFEKYIKDCEKYKTEKPSTPSSEESDVPTKPVEVGNSLPPASTPLPLPPARLPGFPGKMIPSPCTKYLPHHGALAYGALPERRYVTTNEHIPPPSLDQMRFTEETRVRLQQDRENYDSTQRINYYLDSRRPIPDYQNSFQVNEHASVSYDRPPCASPFDTPRPQINDPTFRSRLPPYRFQPESGTRIQLPPIRLPDGDTRRTRQSLGASSETLSESPGSSLTTTFTPSTSDSPSPLSHHTDRPKRLRVQDINDEDKAYDEMPVKRRKPYKEAV